MSVFNFFQYLPIDFGQGRLKHKTKAKLIAFKYIPAPRHGATILDLGCGDGYWSEKFKTLGYVTSSIDGEAVYPNVNADRKYKDMILCDANKMLPFSNASFDVVWCSEVIEHLSNYRFTVTEIARILKPGGIFILTTPNSFFWLHYFLKIFGLSNKDWQNEGHINFFNISDIKRIFPTAQIYGYFPYTIIKCKIKKFIGPLSPYFIIVGKKS